MQGRDSKRNRSKSSEAMNTSGAFILLVACVLSKGVYANGKLERASMHYALFRVQLKTGRDARLAWTHWRNARRQKLANHAQKK